MRPTVGIVGGGQLARMTYQAAISLDVDVRVLAGDEGEPVAGVAADVISGPPTGASLRGFTRSCDVTTFDHEHVDPELVARLERAGRVIRPGAPTLRVAVDKLAQRRRLAGAGFPVPPFAPVRNVSDAARFARRHGWPIVLKRPRGGYDGRGVWPARTEEEAARLLRTGPLLVEPHLSIDTELAVIVARRPAGEVTAYPVAETVQEDGVCREVRVPARLPAALAGEAVALAADIAGWVGAAGVLAVELFVVDGRLVVNELAARPHNSGHFTIEGCATSQFENHLRAILDWPLGSTGLRAPAVAMANVLGAEPPGDPRPRLGDALAAGPVHVHLYGKQPRPGRKLGHVTVLGSDPDEAAALARRAAGILTGSVSARPTAAGGAALAAMRR